LGTKKVSEKAYKSLLKNFGEESEHDWLLWVHFRHFIISYPYQYAELSKIAMFPVSLTFLPKKLLPVLQYFHGIVTNEEEIDGKITEKKYFYIRLSNTKYHTFVWSNYDPEELIIRTTATWNREEGANGWKENRPIQDILEYLFNKLPVDKRDKHLAKAPKYKESI
jgi:hypothetical protein